MKPRKDPLLIALSTGLVCVLLLCLLYVGYLFVSVVYFGGGDACPQNLC